MMDDPSLVTHLLASQHQRLLGFFVLTTSEEVLVLIYFLRCVTLSCMKRFWRHRQRSKVSAAATESAEFETFGSGIENLFLKSLQKKRETLELCCCEVSGTCRGTRSLRSNQPKDCAAPPIMTDIRLDGAPCAFKL